MNRRKFEALGSEEMRLARGLGEHWSFFSLVLPNMGTLIEP